MKTRPIQVTDHEGFRGDALLYQCNHCGGDRFLIFRLVDQDHQHFQCDDCGQSYCPQGAGCIGQVAEGVGHG